MLSFKVFLEKSELVRSLEDRIETLEEENQRKDRDLSRMHQYAAAYLRLTDQIKIARRELKKAGLDTSFLDERI